jgi:hypothetical protein
LPVSPVEATWRNVLAVAPGGLAVDNEGAVIAEAEGFALDTYVTGAGQLVWEWRQADGPRPQFVTRRVALYWMNEYLTRQHRR